MCSAACASSRFLPSEAYGGSFPTTPIPGCMSYWISWALITGCTHGLQVRASSERLEGRRLKKTNGLHRPGVRNGGCDKAFRKLYSTSTAPWSDPRVALLPFTDGLSPSPRRSALPQPRGIRQAVQQCPVGKAQHLS